MRYFLRRIAPEPSLFFQDVFVVGELERSMFATVKHIVRTGATLRSFASDLAQSKSSGEPIDNDMIQKVAAQLKSLHSICLAAPNALQRQYDQKLLLDAGIAESIFIFLGECVPWLAESLPLRGLFRQGHELLVTMMKDYESAACAVSQFTKQLVSQVGLSHKCLCITHAGR